MELSIFLAKWLGIYMLAMALIALVRKEQFHRVMRSISASEGILALAGSINLLGGIALLIGHPVWELSWRVLITLLGVLAVIQGILRLGFTEEIQKRFTPDKMERSYWIIIAVLIVLGLILTYAGFSQ